MSPLTLMLFAWAAITALFLACAMYRSLLSMKEDDQLFLNTTESKMEAEQQAIVARLNRITPWTKGLGAASVGLLVLTGGMWAYQAFTAANRLP